MTKFAVIKIKGHQYKVDEGVEILVDYLAGEKPEVHTLLVVDGDNLELGMPETKKGKVTLKVLEDLVKGDKIYVQKYKAKSRQRRKTGFRHTLTKVTVDKITL